MILNVVIALLAALRLTRFITSDWLGEWWLVSHAKRWANRAEAQPHRGPKPPGWDEDLREIDPENGWRSKLVKGLDCPFCVGFWIVGGCLLVLWLVTRVPALQTVYRLVFGALGANYLTGHIGARFDG